MPIDIISNGNENAMKNEEIINNKVHLENTNNNPNNNESLSIAEATIQEEDLKIIVNEIRFKDQLRNKGFGEVFDNEFILNSL